MAFAARAEERDPRLVDSPSSGERQKTLTGKSALISRGGLALGYQVFHGQQMRGGQLHFDAAHDASRDCLSVIASDAGMVSKGNLYGLGALSCRFVVGT